MQFTTFFVAAIAMAVGAQACIPSGQNGCNEASADNYCCSGNCIKDDPSWEFGWCGN